MGNAWRKNQEQEANKAELVVEPQSDEKLTCEICIEPIETPNKKMRNKDLCSHHYCIECVITYIQTKLGDMCPKYHVRIQTAPIISTPSSLPPLFLPRF
ncbi:hypothetical protein LIER_41674 [Lithospermum erythrorhizon]|uniref:RING-type domain-containing protein n=1 Tax=Lithospermum erythrorhizon TaxID=34254 RepID=A0AAV3REE2_LITER